MVEYKIIVFYSLQAYHCSIPPSGSCVGNLALLPLRTKHRGPAPLMVGDGLDVVDEALQYFKANVFFRTYEVKVMILHTVNLSLMYHP